MDIQKVFNSFDENPILTTEQRNLIEEIMNLKSPMKFTIDDKMDKILEEILTKISSLDDEIQKLNYKIRPLYLLKPSRSSKVRFI